MKYVLITAARNEERYLADTIRSVVSQTLLPERWVIVDDGSSDSTAQIALAYAGHYPWITVVRQPKRADNSFAAKVAAFNAGLAKVDLRGIDVIGNLDADVTFEPGYLAFLLEKFAADPRLGVAGTPFTEAGGRYDSARDSFEGPNHVAGACQLFRAACFAQIGGFTPNDRGGVDWIAVTTARFMGWKTQSFGQMRLYHHRPIGTAQRGQVSAMFAHGQKDYYLGGSPLWQIARVFYRMTKKPLVVGGLALLTGYCWAFVRRVKRPVSGELMRFHRAEQMEKLRRLATFSCARFLLPKSRTARKAN